MQHRRVADQCRQRVLVMLPKKGTTSVHSLAEQLLRFLQAVPLLKQRRQVALGGQHVWISAWTLQGLHEP